MGDGESRGSCFQAVTPPRPHARSPHPPLFASVRRAAAFTFAGILAFAAGITGFAAAFSFAGILAGAGMFFHILMFLFHVLRLFCGRRSGGCRRGGIIGISKPGEQARGECARGD